MTRHTALRALSSEPPAPKPAPAAPPIAEIPPPLPEPRSRYVVQALLSIVALVLLSPILLLIAIAIKLTSQGPVLYAGIRVGRNQRLYTMYKFRTLYDGSEARIGGRLLSSQDDFYTPIGKFLKRSKLDEIPQLINVLRGEMNFVGPRPLRPVFLERYLQEIPHYAERFRVAPGMTGLAQVRGGYWTTPRNKLRYDRLYMAHRSLWLDAQIIALTALKVLNRWITLGAFLLVLLLFVSFLPSEAMEHLYVTVGGAKVNPLHGVIAFGALWMILRRAPADRISLYRTPLNLPIACFLLLSLLSATLSDAPVQAARGAAYYLITGFIVLFAIVNGTFTRSFVRGAINAVALLSAALSAVGILELVAAGYFRAPAGTAQTASVVGVSSTLGSPIALATYLLLGVPCVLCSLTRAHTREARDFWVAATTVCLIGILLTRHPTGLAALAIVATVYLWHYFSTVWALAFLSVLAPFAFLAFDQAVPDGGFSLRSLLCGGAAPACEALGRLPLRELLLGMGPRTLGEIVPAGLPVPDAAFAHVNGNLRLILENGLLGWGAMIWILASAALSLLSAQRRTADPGIRAVQWAILFALLGYAVAMQAFDPFSNIAIQLLFWGLLGIGIGTEVRLGGRSADYRIAFKLGHRD